MFVYPLPSILTHFQPIPIENLTNPIRIKSKSRFFSCLGSLAGVISEAVPKVTKTDGLTNDKKKAEDKAQKDEDDDEKKKTAAEEDKAALDGLEEKQKKDAKSIKDGERISTPHHHYLQAAASAADLKKSMI